MPSRSKLSSTQLGASLGRRDVIRLGAWPALLGTAVEAQPAKAHENFPTKQIAQKAGVLAFARGRMQASNTQVLFADLQPGLVMASITTSTAMLCTAAGALAAGASILGLPMTFSVVHEGGEPGRVIPELAEYSVPANTFDRTSASPLLDAPTVAALARNGRRFLIVAGFSAEVAVLHAVLDALEAGYEVHVPVDAVGSRCARTEAAVLRQMDRAGAMTTSIHTALTRLEPDLSRPPGNSVLASLKGLRDAAQHTTERGK